MADALLFGGHDVERHDGQHRAVHGHRDGHLSERDLVEENLHVLDRIDGHAGLADVARHALVVRIVAAMRGQVEGHREALLPRRQIAAVERVRLFRGGEAGVLADGPRLHGVHGGVGPAQERRNARRIVQVLHGVQIVGRVPRLDRDVLGRHPDRRAFRGPGRRRECRGRSW